MWLKILTFVGAAVAIYFFWQRAMGGKSDRARVPVTKGFRGQAARVEDLEACPQCGAYRTRGDLCACGRAPIP